MQAKITYRDVLGEIIDTYEGEIISAATWLDRYDNSTSVYVRISDHHSVVVHEDDFEVIMGDDYHNYVAVICEDDGEVYDYAYNWETSKSYARDYGRKVIALSGDGNMSKKECQSLYDWEKECHDDCFGVAA